MKYNVWIEGYLCTGMEGCPEPGRLLGTVEAESFKEACALICAKEKLLSLYDSERNTVWGCRLFETEKDARKSFG